MEFFKDAIAWAEIPVTDFTRAKKFYETIFDYEMPEMEMGPVKMGMLLYDQAQQGIGGAICYGEGNQPVGASGLRIYLNGGSDLNTVLLRVEGAGGKVSMPKTLISPEIGYMAFFEDTEGNNLGLFSAG